jgi:hypothetical protein
MKFHHWFKKLLCPFLSSWVTSHAVAIPIFDKAFTMIYGLAWRSFRNMFLVGCASSSKRKDSSLSFLMNFWISLMGNVEWSFSMTATRVFVRFNQELPMMWQRQKIRS